MKVFFDTETTGLPNWKNPLDNPPRMVQLGLIVTDENGKIMRTEGIIFKSENYTIPEEVSKIHGITDHIANVYGVPRSTEFFWHLSDLFHNATEIIAHNYSFDKIILNGELHAIGLPLLSDEKSFCTKENSTNVCKIRGNYGKYKWPKLSEVYKFLFNEEITGAHDALTDVRATMRVYFELKKRQAQEGVVHRGPAPLLV